MPLIYGNRPTGSVRQHSAMRYGGHSGSSAADASTLTAAEFSVLNPEVDPSVQMVEAMLQHPRVGPRMRSFLTMLTSWLIENPAAYAADGWNVPARFLPRAPSRKPTAPPTVEQMTPESLLERLLQIVAMLYRKMLAERHA